MLKNKKKLRRLERNTPGYAVKAARSLVLAGALVGALTLGGAGIASAAAALTGTYTTLQTVTDVHGNEDFSSAVDFQAGFTASGSVNGNYVGLNSAAHKLTISGGTSTMSAGAGLWITEGITISGANTVINASGIMASSASDKPRWRAGTMIGADKGLSMTGGTVNLSDNAQMVVGYEGGTGSPTSYTGMAITGGTVNMSNALLRASSVAGAPIVFNDEKTYSKIVIGGGTGAAIVQTAAGTHNVIASRHTTIGQKGELNINGATMLVGALVETAPNGATKPSGAPDAWMFADQTANGKLINSGGSVAVADSGVLIATGIDYEQTAGTFTANKLTLGADNSSNFKEGDGAAFKSMNVTGGTVTVADSLKVDSTKLSITGGTVNVDGDMLIASTPAAGGTPAVNGNVEMGEGGTLRVTGNLNGEYGQITDSGSNGNTSVTVLGTYTTRGSQGSTAKDSKIDFNSPGTFILGALELKPRAADGTSTLNISQGNVAFLGLDGVKSVFNGEAINVSGSGTLGLGTAGTESVKGGKFDGQVNVSAGNMTVNKGNWTLDKLDVSSSGKADVAGGKLTIGSELKSVANGVKVSNNGVLAGGSTIFVQTDGSNSYKIKDSLNKVLVDATATLEMTWANGTKLSQTQLAAIKGALLDGNSTGLLSHKGATFDLTVESSETALKGTVDAGNAANTGSLLNGYTVGASGTGNANVTVGGFGADALVVKDSNTSGSATATVTIDKTLTLTGAGGTLVTVKDAAGNATGAAVTIDAANKTLNIGSAAAASGSGTLAGVTVGTGGNVAGALNVTNGTYTIGEIKTVGTGNSVVGVDGANLSATKIDLTSATNGALNVVGGGKLHATEITIDTGNTINVGSTTGGAGTLTADSVKLGGGSLFIDPNWGQASSRVAIAQFTDTGSTTDVSAVGGLVGVGMNSMLTVGTNSTAWLDEVVGKLGGLEKEEGYSAALGLYHSVTLNNNAGGILVDGTKTTTDFTGGSAPVADQATFAKGSLLVVNAPAGLGATAALVSGKTGSQGALSLDNEATLLIVNGQAGQTVKITENFTLTQTGSGSDKGWTGENLFTDTDLVYGEGTWDTTNTGNYTVALRGRDATTVFPLLSASMGGLVDNVMRVRDVNSDNAGIRFVSRATSNAYLGTNDAESAAATIEGAAQMGAVAGVQVSTIGAASAASGAVTTRTSFAQPLMDMTKAVAVHQDNEGALSLDTGLNAGNGMKNGLGVWIMPLYQSNKTWGQKAGNFKSGMSSDLGGVALGADYTINDMFRFGAAFNVGGGFGKSSGDFNKTENNFNFWGVNLYGGWTMNNFGLSADVGYTSTYNKVEQDTPVAMSMGKLKSDVTSSAWQAGLKGEYKFETSVVDIVPHVGVRYMGLTTDGYDVKSNGTVFSVEQNVQSIWTFPIGVAFSKTFTSDSGPSAWTFKPMVDLSVIPATGDIKAKSKVSIPGVDGSAEMKMQVVDYVTFDGGLGFEVGKGDLSFGLNYNLQASEHRTGHGVFGTLRYEF